MEIFSRDLCQNHAIRVFRFRSSRLPDVIACVLLARSPTAHTYGRAREWGPVPAGGAQGMRSEALDDSKSRDLQAEEFA